MARIPEAEIERLKREVSIVRLVEARGITLARHGADLIGLCVFHPDTSPSLVVSPSKNLWHCLGACQAGGSVIDWVMKSEGVSFRLAVEMLRTNAKLGSSKKVAKLSTTVKVDTPIDRTADDQQLLAQVVAFYHRTLKQSPEALAYLQQRDLVHPELIDHFQLGFANRTLGYGLPRNNRATGAELRGRLEHLGILRKTGHEHLNGSLVVPIFDEQGHVAGMYGRKITRGLRKGTPLHLYLDGPHRGVFNWPALARSKDIILCESIIDAMTFWCAGFRNVTTSYGVEGFTKELRDALKRNHIERILIAYDRDLAGDSAAEKLAPSLAADGMSVFRVLFPRGLDANEYARGSGDLNQIFSLVIRNAAWMAGAHTSLPSPAEMTTSPAPPVIGQPKRTKATAEPSTADALAGDSDPLVAERGVLDPIAGVQSVVIDLPVVVDRAAVIEQPVAKPVIIEPPVPDPIDPIDPIDPPSTSPPIPRTDPRSTPKPETVERVGPGGFEAKAPTVDMSVLDHEIHFRFGDRRARVRGLDKNKSYDALKINLLVAYRALSFVDSLDLYHARQRTLFAEQAAAELDLPKDLLKQDLGTILFALEDFQAKAIEAASRPKSTEVVISPEDREAALGLLRDPRLLDRILDDFRKLGVVGEETNKLVGYLATISRLLDRPLAVLVQSSSAAGKSSLMEAVLALVPKEHRVKYSAMTGQSLFYIGETDLQHKVLAIVEEEGAERASYALKLLQSEGELTIASTGKNPETGKLETNEYHVEGPVMIFLTTTAIDVDEELLNRCLVLTVDEGKEQTEAIHATQRKSRTLDGLVRRRDHARLEALHQNAQRLLRRLPVVNPFAERLTFAANRTRMRRDHLKYLALIDVIALLHQYQRPTKTTTHAGETIEYVEVTAGDIAIANRLTHQVLGRTLDELPPQTRRLLELLDVMVTKACAEHAVDRANFRFSRRHVRKHTGWGQTQLHLHLTRLVDMEYLIVHRGTRGQSYVYELAYERDADAPPSMGGLVDPDRPVTTIDRSPSTAQSFRGPDPSFRGHEPEFSPPFRPHFGGVSGGFRGHETADSGAQEPSNPGNEDLAAKNARIGTGPSNGTYVKRRRTDVPES
jgi:DNA primase catalytic core